MLLVPRLCFAENSSLGSSLSPSTWFLFLKAPLTPRHRTKNMSYFCQFSETGKKIGILPLNSRGVQRNVLYVDPGKILEEMVSEHLKKEAARIH